MNNSSFIEKRAFPRFAVNIPLSYCGLNSDRAAQAQTHDISAQGLCMITDEELPVGTPLDIRLQMVDNGAKIYKKGIVVWSMMIGPGKYRVGIKLEEPKLNPIPIVLRTIKAQRQY